MIRNQESIRLLLTDTSLCTSLQLLFPPMSGSMKEKVKDTSKQVRLLDNTILPSQHGQPPQFEKSPKDEQGGQTQRLSNALASLQRNGRRSKAFQRGFTNSLAKASPRRLPSRRPPSSRIPSGTANNSNINDSLNPVDQRRFRTAHLASSRMSKGGTIDSHNLERTTAADKFVIHDPVQFTVKLHDTNKCPDEVILDPSLVPGATYGDVAEIESLEGTSKKFFFVFKKPTMIKSQANTNTPLSLNNINSVLPQGNQISIISSVSTLLELKPRSLVLVRLKKRDLVEADVVEIYIKDLHLSRGDMWNMTGFLQKMCLHRSKRVTFINGKIKGFVNKIYRNGKKVFSGYIGKSTKIVYRSESARFIVFIQISAEMWHFDGSGEQLFNKFINSLLPEIFKRWKEMGTNHLITIVLFTSVKFPGENTDKYKASGNEFITKDYYRVVVDQVSILLWSEIMATLRLEFSNFKKNVLSPEMAKRSTTDPYLNVEFLPSVKGNLFQAINLGMSLVSDDFSDPDLRHTTNHFLIISPGTGLFDVDYNLLVQTSKLMSTVDSTIDLLCLSPPPLHVVPLVRYIDEKNTIKHCIPSWMDISFWSDISQSVQQWLPRCKIYQLQMMGIMENELNTVNVNSLDLTEEGDASLAMDYYDNEVFSNENSSEEILDLPKPRRESLKIAKANSTQEPKSTSSQIPPPTPQISADSIQATESELHSPEVYKSTPVPIPTPDFTQKHKAITIPVPTPSPPLKPKPTDNAVLIPAVKSTHSLTHKPAHTLNPRTIPKYKSQANSEYKPNHIKDQRSAPIEPPKAIESKLTQSKSRSIATPIQAPKPAPTRLKIPKVTTDPTPELFPKPLMVPKRSLPSLSEIQRQNGLTIASKHPVSEISKIDTNADIHVFKSDTSAISSMFDIMRKGTEAGAALSGIKCASPTYPIPELVSPKPSILNMVKRMISTPRLGAISSDTGANTTASSGTIREMLNGNLPNPAESDITSDFNLDDPKSEITPMRSSNIAVPRGSFKVRGLGVGSIRSSFKERRSTVSMATNSNSTLVSGKLNKINSKISTKFKKSNDETNLIDLYWTHVKNPSNAVTEELKGMVSYGRWQFVFPKDVRRATVKWTSLTSPAALPVTTSVFPLPQDFTKYFTFRDYGVIWNQSEVDMGYEPNLLMRNMVSLRLSLGFQICVGNRVIATEDQRTEGSSGKLISSSEDITPGSRLFLSLGHEIHRIVYENNSTIKVQVWSRNSLSDSIIPTAEAKDYTEFIRTRYAEEYSPVTIKGSQADVRNNYNWNQLDQLIAGFNEGIETHKKSHRMKFVILPTKIHANSFKISNEQLSPEEIRLEGIRSLISMMFKSRYQSPDENKDPIIEPEINFYTGNLFEFLKAASAEFLVENKHTSLFVEAKFDKSISFNKLVPALLGEGGIKLQDRKWHLRIHPNCFVGTDLVSWLVANFSDIKDRTDAASYGNQLMEQGLFYHVEYKHNFIDGHYFYGIHKAYQLSSSKKTSLKSPVDKAANEKLDSPTTTASGASDGLSPQKSAEDGSIQRSLSTAASLKNTLLGAITSSPQVSSTTEDRDTNSLNHSTLDSNFDERRKITLSRKILINLDKDKKSWRPELATVHYDIVHNPEHCFHIRLEWLNTTTKLIEDAVDSWAKHCTRYGLTLVEIPWEELCMIPIRNPLHSTIDITLGVDPWKDREFCSITSSSSSKYFYHLYLLDKSGFLLDNRTANYFSDSKFDVSYSWGKPSFKYAQFIHITGAYMAELRENGDFFLAPNNAHIAKVNLQIGQSQLGGGIHQKQKHSVYLDSQSVMLDFRNKCKDENLLRELFREAKKKLEASKDMNAVIFESIP